MIHFLNMLIIKNINFKIKKCFLHSKQLSLVCLFYFAHNVICAAQPGNLDTTFNNNDLGFGNGDGPNRTVECSIIQSDGKILIGGWFEKYNNSYKGKIVRLNSDGTLDTSFNTGTGANDRVFALAIQNDGKIIIGGEFLNYNGIAIKRMARLNIDGTIDTSFNVGSSFDAKVNSIAIQSDGKIVVVGDFSSYNGFSCNKIARINLDGTFDNSFFSGIGFNNFVYKTIIQNDGKILIGGGFNSYNGSSINKLARINSDGSIDTTFNSGVGPSSSVRDLTVLPNGKIILAGDFLNYNGVIANKITRINENGTLDTSFNNFQGTNGSIFRSIVQNDGSILIAGTFTTCQGITCNKLAKLSANGIFDSTFVSPLDNTTTIYNINLQADGKIIVAGDIPPTGNYFVSIGYLKRIDSNGDFDTTFNKQTGFNGSLRDIKIQTDGKIIALGDNYFAFNGKVVNQISRINFNGSLDTTFNTGVGPDYGLHTCAIQSDGKIIVGGGFTSFDSVNTKKIARLNSNGDIDTSFNSGFIDNFGAVFTINIQNDDKIVIGGVFPNYSGVQVNNITRLNPDGSIDPSFYVGFGADNVINCSAIQSDGKILVGGDFMTIYNNNTMNRIARLNTDGSLDNTFNIGYGANGSIKALAIQPDGKIIIGGSFGYFNVVPRNNIARLNTDGSLDLTFNPGMGTNGIINTINIQSDGKIIIGGAFGYYNLIANNGIARLNTDGSYDNTFNTGSGIGPINNAGLNTIAIQSDGDILIGGNFTSYNNIGRNRIARIKGGVGVITQNKTSIEINTNLFSLFPNPNSGKFTLECKNCNGADITITSLIGNTIIKSKKVSDKIEFDLNDKPKGLYFLHITDQLHCNFVSKIIVE